MTSLPDRTRVRSLSQYVIRMGKAESIGASNGRKTMEDASFVDTLTTAGGLQITLAVIADGIGGEAFGERASSLAIETIVESIIQSSSPALEEVMRKGAERANQVIYQEGNREPQKTGMGSTLIAVLIHNQRLFLASVGDSRAYLIRGSRAYQLNEDHTWVNEMVRAGAYSVVDAAIAPQAGMLSRSLGESEIVEVDSNIYLDHPQFCYEDSALLLQPGDHILVCSDGLIKLRPDKKGHCVELEEIAPIVESEKPAKSASLLVQKALARNANDNITAIVISVGASSAAARTSRRLILIAALLASFLLLGFLSLHGPSAKSEINPRAAPTSSPANGDMLRVINADGQAYLYSGVQVPLALASGTSIPIHERDRIRSFSSPVEVALPEAIKLFLDRNAELEIMRLPGVSPNAQGELRPVRGRILVFADAAEFHVSEAISLLAHHAIFGMEWGNAENFRLECLSGNLVLEFADRRQDIREGSSLTRIGAQGNFAAAIRWDIWINLGKEEILAIAPTIPPAISSVDARTTPSMAPTHISPK